MTAGGKRPGAGPKLKYGEPTENLVIRVPKSKKAAIKKVVLGELGKYLVKKKVVRFVTNVVQSNL